jgi:hypothetical protein
MAVGQLLLVLSSPYLLPEVQDVHGSVFAANDHFLGGV